MKIQDLKVGQRVICRKEYGTIIDLSGLDTVGIKFDKKKATYHSCNGQCEFGYGWYANTVDITRIPEEPSKNETEEYDFVELSKETRLRVSQIINGNVVVKDSKVYKKVKKEYTEMTVKEIEKKLNVKNLKIVE